VNTDTLLEEPPRQVLIWLHAAASRLEVSVAQFDDDALAAPSALPGWTRGHVVAHLILNGEGFVAMTEAALEGRRRELYPGGVAERNGDIERDAAQPASEAGTRLRDVNRRLHELWDGLDPAGWRRPVAYKDGTIATTLAARWREVQMHHTDLEAGYPASAWSARFSEHAVDFLLPRLPAEADAELVATDTGRVWQHGTGHGLGLRGAAWQLAAWISGRGTADPLEVTGGPVPELGPWP
jgi:maleylpyruvate isomerase